MYGMGETAQVYSLFPVTYVVEREYDGSKAVVATTNDYETAVEKAMDEGESGNTAQYYAKVRVKNAGIVVWESNYPIGWTSPFKGD